MPDATVNIKKLLPEVLALQCYPRAECRTATLHNRGKWFVMLIKVSSMSSFVASQNMLNKVCKNE